VKAEAALRLTATSALPDGSPTLTFACSQATVGAGSSSVIVTVLLLGVPSAALFGLLSVTVKVSFASSAGSDDP